MLATLYSPAPVPLVDRAGFVQVNAEPERVFRAISTNSSKELMPALFCKSALQCLSKHAKISALRKETPTRNNL